MSQELKTFFDPKTYTLTYIVHDLKTKDAVVVDPVLDFDEASGKISHHSVDKVLDYVNNNQLKVHYILETHAHADHLTGAQVLREKIPGAKVAIGKNITEVQETFKGVFNLKDLKTNGEQFDVLLDEENILSAGSIEVKTLFTPGHTPACSSYLIGDRVFTGDALFMPDFGTGRCDFPKGSAEDLYHSVHEKLYSLPDETKVLTGHDYQPGGRELQYESTIGEQKEKNIQLKASTTKEEYIKFRTERDAKLSAPHLLLPSIQVNIDGGNLPKEEDNGTRYLKLPLSEA